MELARNDLTTFWAALNVQGSPILVKNALLEFFPELVAAYGDTAALLAADFYDELRDVPPSAKRFTALLSDPVDSDQAQAAARWALGPLFAAEPDPVQVLANLSGVAQRLVLQSGRDTIARSSFLDPVRTAFARVPTGTKTCRFCIMLASRGAIYASSASAGEANKYHGDCDCVPTPIRSKRDYPDGHDVAEFQRLYAADSGVGRDIPTD